MLLLIVRSSMRHKSSGLRISHTSPSTASTDARCTTTGFLMHIQPKVEAKLQPGLQLLRRTGLRMQAVNPIMMARIWRFGEGPICRAIIVVLQARPLDSATKMMTTTSFMGRADNCYVVFLDILTTRKCNAAL